MLLKRSALHSEAYLRIIQDIDPFVIVNENLWMDDIITIDGPAGSGKSTIARLLAKRINYIYLDTGAMYRAIALAATRKGIDLADGKKLTVLCDTLNLHFDTTQYPPRLFIDAEDVSLAIRSPEMDLLSSNVSAVREVRQAMTEFQRALSKGKKIVAEGRDTGTVVFPNARCKFFLTASPEIRADRRYIERRERGEKISKNQVTEDLYRRDNQDQTRSLAPLKPAPNAIVIDSSALTPDEVLEEISNHLDTNEISEVLTNK